MNLYDATLGEGARSIKLGSQEIDLPEAVRAGRPALAASRARRSWSGCAPSTCPRRARQTGPKLVGEVD